MMLLLGNGVCSGGIATYFTLINYGVWGTFGLCSSIIFLAFWAIHEVMLRRSNRLNSELIDGARLIELCERNGLEKWSPQKIEESVKNGAPLVICDNLVLDVGTYEKFHPGGKFTLTKNYGRDIAKFYYGNYTLTSDSKAHTHSG